jgi:hypothetical protein
VVRGLDYLQDWFGTPLGLGAFLADARAVVNEAQYELLMRWASRREPRLTNAELDEVGDLAQSVIAALEEKWKEGLEVRAASRSAAERGEPRLD